MTSKGTYVVNMRNVAVSAAISIIQVKAGTTTPLELIRAVVTQQGSTTSQQARIGICRKSGAATVTSFTPLLLDPGDAVAGAVGGTAATGTNASAEGTDGDVLVDEGFNVLNGWLWLPTPEERIWVQTAGIVALKFFTAPTSINVCAALYFREFKG